LNATKSQRIKASQSNYDFIKLHVTLSQGVFVAEKFNFDLHRFLKLLDIVYYFQDEHEHAGHLQTGVKV
jgi:hypothetical protein